VDKLTLYSEIKGLYDQGFSLRRIAKKLDVSRNTVTSYLNRQPDEMGEWLASTKVRRKSLDTHQPMILQWLKEHPDLSAAQVCDWLEEKKFGKYAESTVRRYVKELRSKYKIVKTTKRRQYEAVPQLPPGLQGQIDFGQTVQKTPTGKNVKLYFYAHVLSHSRYKYVEWQKRPFRTEDLIRCLENTFLYFGGKPKEIVFDQDRIIVVSENAGDIIYTQEFQAFKQAEHLETTPCRGFDPESKGKIENVVKFVKSSFAKERVFSDIDSWNEECRAWLVRRGNGRQHNLTKQIPAEVFKEEQKHLQPVNTYQREVKNGQERKVRKDNTIMYQGNRYSVPLGTYNAQGTLVNVFVDDQQLVIRNINTGMEIAKHRISSGHGGLIQNSNHRRDRSLGISELIEVTAKKFDETVAAYDYLTVLRTKYPRYIRDQIQVIRELFDAYPPALLSTTLDMCIQQKIYNASGFKEMVIFLEEVNHESDQEVLNMPDLPIDAVMKERISTIHPEVRSLDVYSKLVQGGRHGTN
jgi:transposase